MCVGCASTQAKIDSEEPLPSVATGTNTLHTSSLNTQGKVPRHISDSEYRVHTLDVLRIDVYGEPDISRDYQVGENGAINHPLLGDVRVDNMPLDRVQATLTKALAADYLVDPHVSVRVVRSTGRRVMVFGEVAAPGTYEIAPDEPMTLLQAIALAGGFTDIAAYNRVRLVRIQGEQEISMRIDVSDLLKGKPDARDTPLLPGDVITVPESAF